MQYILSQEEYNDLVPRKERDELVKAIDLLRNFVIPVDKCVANLDKYENAVQQIKEIVGNL